MLVNVLFQFDWHFIEPNGIRLSNNVPFCCFMKFWVLLRPILRKLMQLCLQNYLREIPGLVIVNFFTTISCKEAQKLYKQRPKNVKKLEILSSFQYLNQSEETLDHKLGILLQHVLRTEFQLLEFFDDFILPKFYNLK